MKSVLSFLSCIAICASFIFSSCQKDQLRPVQAADHNSVTPKTAFKQTNPGTKTEAFRNNWTFPPPICMYLGTAVNDHCELPSGFCHLDWHDWRFQEINKAPGFGNVDENNTMTFEFDVTNVDPAYMACINDENVFRVAQDYQLPDDIVQSMYDQAGLSKPEGSFFLPAGEYPVERQIAGGGGEPCWEDHVIVVVTGWEYYPGLGLFPSEVSIIHIKVPCSGNNQSAF